MFEDEIGSVPPRAAHQVEYRYVVGEVVDGGRYIVDGFLGQGGMGSVLRVINAQTGTIRALKYCNKAEDYKRFSREVKAMARVDHEHVIPILEANPDHDPPYFVMPLAERSLEAELPRICGQEDAVLPIFLTICKGIEELHQGKMIHRDVKPANVLYLEGGRIVVSDLGLVLFQERDTTMLTRTLDTLGTEAYRPPEDSKNADARSDVYQLGKVLYHLFTGLNPKMVRIPKLPKGLQHVVRRATMEDPDERYQSVLELVNGIRGYIKSKDPSLNPREVLTSLIAATSTSRPAPDTLKSAFESLGYASHKPHQEFLELFHLLPDDWLRLFAKGRPLEFYAILTRYAEALDAKSGGMPYAFADEVTARMIALYKSIDDTSIQVTALRCAMHAAHRLDQHSAQREFGSHLATIQSYELALPISEMLETHAPSEILKFHRFPLGRMHVHIQGSLGLVAQRVEVEAFAEEEQEGEEWGTITSKFKYLLNVVDGNLVFPETLEDTILALPKANFDKVIEQLSAVREGDCMTDRLDTILRTWLQDAAIDSTLVPPIRTLDELDSFISFLRHFRREPANDRSMTARDAQVENSVEEFRQRLADQRD